MIRWLERWSRPRGQSLFGNRLGNVVFGSVNNGTRVHVRLYDSEGNRIRIIHPDGNHFNYEYDGLERFTRLRENGGGSGEVEPSQWSHRGRATV